MNNHVHSRRRHAEYTWPLVLCLIGVDYFSTLAYLPSMAVAAAGPFAPIAAGGVVVVTFLLALPVYWYIVGRCSDGRGAAGLIERLIPGWKGKLLVLSLLGFAAVDFVITRSLSLADAAIHLIQNPWGRQLLDRQPLDSLSDHLSSWPALSWCAEQVEDPQVVTTFGLSILSLVLWQLLKHGVSRAALYVASASVLCYLAVTGVVVIAACQRLVENPRIVNDWWSTVGPISDGAGPASAYGWVWTMVGVALCSFPQLALGLSGFEMSMTLSPHVSGKGRDGLGHASGRVRNMRKLMLSAAMVMAALLLAVVMITTLLVPHEAMTTGGPAQHRALAYLAHGEPLTGTLNSSNPGLNLGAPFALLFDAATVLILCLAGVSVTMSVQTLLPHYLNRLGMDFLWAGRVGGILLTLHGVVLVVTIVFQASPASQQWAYATSVLALLGGAALAALLELNKSPRHGRHRLLLVGISAAAGGVFATMVGMIALINLSGLAIAAGFIAAILICSFTSRWLRSTELRFHGFRFADNASRRRWGELRRLGDVVLIPHRPGLTSIATKRIAVQLEFRLDVTRPILFIEAELGDPSNFFQKPLMRIERAADLEVLRVSQCVSIAHVLAAIALELCSNESSRAEMIFGWSNERPLASNLNFLLFGEGNVPWLVKDLVTSFGVEMNERVRIKIG